jgi:predicted DNA-binding protein
MPDEYRVTIRLSPELYAQLEARGSQGQPLAAIVRQALMAYLERQPDQPRGTEDLAEMVAAMAARLQDLQDQLASLTARVDAMAASWQLMAAGEQFAAAEESSPAADRQPTAASELSPAAGEQTSAADDAAPAAPIGSRTAAERQPQPATPVPPVETLPTHIQRIAEVAAQYDKLSLAELSQLLFDRDIYRATAKDGRDLPVNKGTLHKWLGRARRAGML